MELQSRFEQLQRQGVGLAAVSYDPIAVLADFSTRRAVTFPLLSDPGSLTIKQYGIFNTTIPETNAQAYGIPFPGTFLVNAHGVVTSRFFEPAYQERNTVGSILARLGKQIDVAATKVSSPQLEVTTYATDSTVAPGTTPPVLNNPSLPPYAWPSYASYPNYAQVTYPQQYSASAWPYIGPFYPYPQVPLGWRQVQLEWDDGSWNLNFRPRTDRWWWFLDPKNW